jgi:hypothetical protein
MRWPMRRRWSRQGVRGEPGREVQPGDAMRRAAGASAVVAGLLVLTACTSGSGSGSGASSSANSAQVSVLPGGEGDTTVPTTHAPASTPKKTPTPKRTTSKPAKTTAHKTTSAKPTKVREIARACPYISNNDEQIAEGKKVGRSTVLTTSPVGCRFYLAYPDYHAVAEITAKKYPTELSAFNTVARTGGSTAESTPGVGDGAVLYRTRFYKSDGNRDWACIFAKGKTVVTVHTDAAMSSVDARNVAVAIVDKF